MDTPPRPRATRGSARSQGKVVRVIAVALAVFAAAVIAFVLHENNRSSEPKHPATPLRTLRDHTSVEHIIEQAGYTGIVCNNGVNPVGLVRSLFTCLAHGDQRIVVTILNDKGDYVWVPAN